MRSSAVALACAGRPTFGTSGPLDTNTCSRASRTATHGPPGTRTRNFSLKRRTRYRLRQRPDARSVCHGRERFGTRRGDAHQLAEAEHLEEPGDGLVRRGDDELAAERAAAAARSEDRRGAGRVDEGAALEVDDGPGGAAVRLRHEALAHVRGGEEVEV